MKTNEPDYTKLTNEEFEAILERLVSRMTASQILSYGDVSVILREELNNEILETWERENPHLAFPSQNEEKEARLVGNSMEGWKVETVAQGGVIASESFRSLALAEQRLDELQTEYALGIAES